MTAAAKPPRAKLRESRLTVGWTVIVLTLIIATLLVAGMVAPR